MKLLLLRGVEVSLAMCDITQFSVFDEAIALLSTGAHVSKPTPQHPAGGFRLWKKKHPILSIHIFIWALAEVSVKLEAQQGAVVAIW